MDDLQWVCKKRQKGCDKDVSVRLNKQHNSIATAFTFRNKCHLQFTKNLLVVFAVKGSRIYFKQEGRNYGYKLSEQHGSLNPSYVFKSEIDLRDFIGDHDLLYDDELRLNYIEKESEEK